MASASKPYHHTGHTFSPESGAGGWGEALGWEGQGQMWCLSSTGSNSTSVSL